MTIKTSNGEEEEEEYSEDEGIMFMNASVFLPSIQYKRGMNINLHKK